MTSNAQAAAMLSAAAKKGNAHKTPAEVAEGPVPKAKGTKIKLPGGKVKPPVQTAAAPEVPVMQNVLHEGAKPSFTHGDVKGQDVSGTLQVDPAIMEYTGKGGMWQTMGDAKEHPNHPVIEAAIKTEQGKAIIEVTHPDGTVESAEEAVGKPKHFTQPNCTVGFGAKYRKNMGNYESAEVSVFLSVPAAHGEINKVYDFAVGWVDERMNAALEMLSNAKG